MARKSIVERNKKRERLAAKFANRRATLKAKAKDAALSLEERFEARLKLAELSRIALRDLASTGQIPGMVKSSW